MVFLFIDLVVDMYLTCIDMHLRVNTGKVLFAIDIRDDHENLVITHSLYGATGGTRLYIWFPVLQNLLGNRSG